MQANSCKQEVSRRQRQLRRQPHMRRLPTLSAAQPPCLELERSTERRMRAGMRPPARGRGRSSLGVGHCPQLCSAGNASAAAAARFSSSSSCCCCHRCALNRLTSQWGTGTVPAQPGQARQAAGRSPSARTAGNGDQVVGGGKARGLQLGQRAHDGAVDGVVAAGGQAGGGSLCWLSGQEEARDGGRRRAAAAPISRRALLHAITCGSAATASADWPEIRAFGRRLGRCV